MRPHQWLKNAFVFAGLVFSQSWQDGPLTQRVLYAFAAFCCLSSMVYIINDWHDRASDALHPTKRHRPLASGAVSPLVGMLLAGLLLVAGLLLAAGNRTLLVLLGVYVALNLAYSWRLKQVPVIDVSIIASGFMLRLLAGTVAVGIPPSRWLLLTGIFVALFLGFSKRKAESFHDEASQRAVLAHYPAALLDTFMAVAMAATVITYSLFATSPEGAAAARRALALHRARRDFCDAALHLPGAPWPGRRRGARPAARPVDSGGRRGLAGHLLSRRL
ncbi:UbiA prenyltransferase family protein [Polaromonas sp. P2-4]|nr:UbiA prenyltransferase family protein [Polaromonas sp. P2-4]